MKIFLILLLIIFSTAGITSEEKRIRPNPKPNQEIIAQAEESKVIFAMESIIRYLDEYPLAIDTLEGVHTWWIEWPEIAPDISITLIALETLEKQKVVERRRFGSKIIWRKVH